MPLRELAQLTECVMKHSLESGAIYEDLNLLPLTRWAAGRTLPSDTLDAADPTDDDESRRAPAPSSSPSLSPPSPSPLPPLPKRGARAVPAVSRARAEWLPPCRRGVAAAVFSCARSVSEPPAVRRRTRSTISSFH